MWFTGWSERPIEKKYVTRYTHLASLDETAAIAFPLVFNKPVDTLVKAMSLVLCAIVSKNSLYNSVQLSFN